MPPVVCTTWRSEVDFQGVRYAMPAGACGIPATLRLYPEQVRISTAGGRFEAMHPRFPRVGGRRTARGGLERYLHPHVLVIDELGYQSYAADAANVLFRVVSSRHLRRRSTLVTTSKPLAALRQGLHDADLAEAILDRLLERGSHFVLLGRSYRTRHQKEDLSSVADTDAT